MTPHKILIAGAGTVGLLTSLCLSKQGIKTRCIHPPVKATVPHDARTVALLQSSISLLKNLGIWKDLKEVSTPLEVMRICDRTGNWPQIADTDFKASELELEAFAYNVPLASLTKHLFDLAHKDENITFHDTGGVKNADISPSEIHVTTEDGKSYSAALAIGADGPESSLRKAAHIQTSQWKYNQTAIAFQVEHTKPHFNISTEYHFNEGPLVVVPMPGYKAGIVWVVEPSKAELLLSLDKQDFEKEFESATEKNLGGCTLISERSSFPLGGLTADKFASRRVALVGHAAHVLPPVGAQGLNLGFRDAASLADILEETTLFDLDPGESHLLNSYDAMRKKDVLSRTFGVNMLNMSMQYSNLLPVHLFRATGLSALRNSSGLRKAVMRQGLGADLKLPKMMHVEEEL